MSNIREIKTFKTQCHEQTIEILRQYLAWAEAGEIEAIAIAAIEPGGACRTQATGSNDFQRMIGSIEILKIRMLVDSGRTDKCDHT